jgi:uncharacterized protein (TIGR03067 family)
MQDGSSTTRGVTWIAVALLLGGLLLPLASFVTLTRLTGVAPTSAATIAFFVGLGFACLLSLALAIVDWRHAAGKVTAIGAVLLGVLATVAVWPHFLQPASELDGIWQAVRFELQDGVSNNAAASVTRLTIAGEKLKQSGMLPDIDGFITTDATQNPKTFDAGGIRGTGDGVVSFSWTGIYEREGDTLKLCFATVVTGERPKEFKSNPAALLILKRVK